MDLTDTIVPKSDQINAEDLLTGPRTFTIKEVRAGSAEQPVNVLLEELPGRPYRPSKSMRRVFVALWGKNTEPYSGRKITLYRDALVKFGGDPVGGIKISHMSHIDGTKSIPLTETRGKRALHTVEPLTDDVAPAPKLTETEMAIADLTTEWHEADPERRKAIEAEVAALRATVTDPDGAQA